MPPLNDGEMFTLGELTGKLDALIRTVDEDRQYSAAQRNAMRELLQALAESNRTANALRENWQREWANEWQPLIEEFRTYQNQLEGRRQVTRVVSAFWLSISGAAVALFTFVLQHFWNAPKP